MPRKLILEQAAKACSVHPAIGRWDLCSGDRLPKARSRWRNPRVALTFTIHGSATWAPAGCAATSRSSLSAETPPPFPGPVTRLRSPRAALGLPAWPATWAGVGPGPLPPGRTSASGQDLPRAPGGARARYEADRCPVPELTDDQDPCPRKKPGARPLIAEISFSLSNCRLAGSERCPARCWQSRFRHAPGSAPSQGSPRSAGGGAQIPGAGGEPHRRGPLGRDLREVAGWGAVVRSIARSQ